MIITQTLFYRFHAIYFPAMLQGLDLPLSQRLLTHAHWTMNQKKMSKSVGNVADPFKAMEHYGVDAVRYYMARIGGRFRDDVGQSPNAIISLLVLRLTPHVPSSRLVRCAAQQVHRRDPVIPWKFLPTHNVEHNDDSSRKGYTSNLDIYS
jgi:methionyl-tRNA synthetase